MHITSARVSNDFGNDEEVLLRMRTLYNLPIAYENISVSIAGYLHSKAGFVALNPGLNLNRVFNPYSKAFSRIIFLL